MQSHRAERLVRASAAAVRSAIGEVMQTLWPGDTRSIVDEGHDLTYVVHFDESAAAGDVWLSWSLTEVVAGTHVRVVLDEVDDGPDATDELARLLDVVATLTHDIGFIPG